MMMQDLIAAFWHRFLIKTNLPKDTTYLESFYFDTSKESADHLCDLVLKGIKKATASSLYHYQATGEEMPKVGDYSVVTNFRGEPFAVIMTTKISIIPYKDLTFDVVKREGEDETLESWQEKHQRFYEIDGKQSGYTFNEDMPVVFEDFEVVYKEKETCK